MTHTPRNTKLFISWSGSRAECLGNRLREWVPLIIPGLDPFFSSQKGPTRGWLSVIERELKLAKYAFVCITPDSLQSPWLNFETGALWLSAKKPSIYLILHGLAVDDVRGPLETFQCVPFEEERLRTMCREIARTVKMDDGEFRKTWMANWPCLSRDVKSDLEAPALRTRKPIISARAKRGA